VGKGALAQQKAKFTLFGGEKYWKESLRCEHGEENKKKRTANTRTES